MSNFVKQYIVMRQLTVAHPPVGIAALIFVDVDLGVGRMTWLFSDFCRWHVLFQRCPRSMLVTVLLHNRSVIC